MKIRVALHVDVAEKYISKKHWGSALYHLLRASEIKDTNFDENRLRVLLANVLYKNGMREEALGLYVKLSSSQNQNVAILAKKHVKQIQYRLEKDKHIRRKLENNDIL